MLSLVDRRLQEEALRSFLLDSFRYVDNIIEGILSFVNTVKTGETDAVYVVKKRVASREGSIFDPSPYRLATGQELNNFVHLLTLCSV